jgi:hypothetical protein
MEKVYKWYKVVRPKKKVFSTLANIPQDEQSGTSGTFKKTVFRANIGKAED